MCLVAEASGQDALWETPERRRTWNGSAKLRDGQEVPRTTKVSDLTRPPETRPPLMRVLWPTKVGGGGHHGNGCPASVPVPRHAAVGHRRASRAAGPRRCALRDRAAGVPVAGAQSGGGTAPALPLPQPSPRPAAAFRPGSHRNATRPAAPCGTDASPRPCRVRPTSVVSSAFAGVSTKPAYRACRKAGSTLRGVTFVPCARWDTLGERRGVVAPEGRALPLQSTEANSSPVPGHYTTTA